MRDKNIDIIKGIGIVLIVAGHALCPYSYWFVSWFVQIFFIASGYVYNHKYSESIIGGGQLLTKRIKSLYIPWLVINFIYICCNNMFIKFNILTNNPAFLEAERGNFYGIDRILSVEGFFISLKKAILFQGAQKACGAIWFLATLFLVEIVYWGLEYICRKIGGRNSILIFDMTLLAIYGMSVHFTINEIIDTSGYKLNQVGLSLFIFHLGSKFRDFSKTKKLDPLFLCFVSLSVMYVINYLKIGRVNYARGDIKSGVYLFICSMAGWFLLYGISEIVLYSDNILSRFFIYLGKHTLFILLLHQISFKFITLIQVYVYREPEYMLAAFPVLYDTGSWWIAYTIIGIVVPLCIEKIFNMMKVRLHR